MDKLKAIRLYKIGLSLPQGSTQSQHCFDLSIEADSTFSYAYFEKSVPYNKRGDYAEGFQLLNRAVKLNPKMHLGYRGWLRLVKVKDYQGCIEDLNQLSKIKSKNTLNAWGQNINYLMGLSYLGLQEPEKSIEYFDIAIEETKNVENMIVPFYKSIALYKLNHRVTHLVLEVLKMRCKFDFQNSVSFYSLSQHLQYLRSKLLINL